MVDIKKVNKNADKLVNDLKGGIEKFKDVIKEFKGEKKKLLQFPKPEFDRNDVEIFREVHLDYGKAWKLIEAKDRFYLKFDEELFDDIYANKIMQKKAMKKNTGNLDFIGGGGDGFWK